MFRVTSTLLLFTALAGTTFAAVYIGDNQDITGYIRSGPYEDVVIGGRPGYNSGGGSGLYIGNNNRIRGNVRSDLPPGASLNLGPLLSSLPGNSYYSRPRYNNYNGYSGYNGYNGYNNGYRPGGGGGITIGNNNRLRGGIATPL